MKRFALIALVLFAFVAGSVAGILTTRNTATVRAQDGEMLHTCDSSTVLLLFLAEYYFDYTSEDMDLASFEKGQFAPLFDMMMMGMEDMEDMEDEEMSEEEMAEMETALAVAEAAIMEMMGEMEGMAMLGGVEGEDEACTALRDDVQYYLIAYIYAESMMMEEME